MGNVTYQELVELYGQKAAYALLRVIEVALHEKSNVIHIDNEKRLQHALVSMSREPLAA
ncbi:MAG: hypothetical protein PHD48_10190 [Alphaproteobacteria bacterium]|nr:hypothetical protein [Alphaproteobacteria bacterium]